jgi:heat shock protein HslJ
MTRTRRGLLAASITAGILLASAVPAMAGDAAPAAGSIVGHWTTKTQGVAQTVTFDRKGHVYGDAGCNRFTGSYTVTGSHLKIGPLASTMMFCDGKMNAESAFLTKLQAATSYSATSSTLHVFTPKDVMVLHAG